MIDNELTPEDLAMYSKFSKGNGVTEHIAKEIADEMELDQLVCNEELKDRKFRKAVIQLSRELFVVSIRDSGSGDYGKQAANCIEAARVFTEQIRDMV